MSKSFKIKKYWSLTLCLLFCSLTAVGHDYNSIVTCGKSNDTIVPLVTKGTISNMKLASKVYTGLYEKSDPVYGVGKPNARPGKVLYINTDGQLVEQNNMWKGYDYPITYPESSTPTSEYAIIACPGVFAVLKNSNSGSENQNACIGTAIGTITYAFTSSEGSLMPGVSQMFPGGNISISGPSPSSVYTLSIFGTPTTAGNWPYQVVVRDRCGTPLTVSGSINAQTKSASAASASPTLCVNTALTAITHTTVGATGIGTPSGLPTGVTVTWASNIITLSGTPTTVGTFNYIIPLSGSCAAVNAIGTIIVTSNQTVSGASASPTLCINTPLTPITHTTTRATAIGTPIGLPAGVTAIWNANTITISGTPSTSGTFNYSIPLSGDCGAINAIGTIIVIPSPTVSAASASPTLCVNSALTPIIHTTTDVTGNTNGGSTANNLPPGVTVAWGSNTLRISGTPTTPGTYNYSIALNSCEPIISATGTIIVLSNTIGEPSSSPTLCINTPLTPITHTTSGATSIQNSYGLPPGVTATLNASTIVISGTPTNYGIYNYSITPTGPCPLGSARGTITVTPNLAAASASDSPTLCINTTLTPFTQTTVGANGIGTPIGLPAGINAAWASNNITISGTPTESGTFNYSIPLSGACGAATATGRMTVLPANTMTLISGAGSDAQNACFITDGITPIKYAYTGRIPVLSGLPTGFRLQSDLTEVTITGITNLVGSFPYTLTQTNECGTTTTTGTVTSIVKNTIALSSSVGTNNQTVCINAPITNITYATTGATGAIFSKLPPGVTGSFDSNVITISGTPTVTGPFNYDVVLEGGCGNYIVHGSINVTPANTMTLYAAGTDDQTICLSTAITTIIYTTTGATGAIFSGLPNGVTGNWAANVVRITGTPTDTGTFNYTVTQTGGCGLITKTGTLIVTPVNTSTLSSIVGTDTQTKCISTAITPIKYTTTGATGATYSGLPTGISGNWTANEVTISGTPVISGTFNYTVTLTGGCGTVTKTGTLIITPNQTVGIASTSPTLCINTALTPITHTTTGATGITNNGVSGANGLPTGVSATWANNKITISGTPDVTGTFNYSIPLAGACGTVNATGKILVNASNSVSSASATPTICANTTLTNITHNTTGATGIANNGISGANGLPTGVSATWANNTITISGTPDLTGTFNYSIPLSGGCGTTSAIGTIVVNANNSVSAASAAPTLCAGTDLTAITHTTTGATGIANSGISGANGLPEGISATWANNTITISGAPEVTGTFNYSIPVSGICGSVNAIGTIIVTANNTVDPASEEPTLCINTALTPITHTTTGATGIANNGVSGANGLPTGVSATWTNNTITITGTPTVAGTFNYDILISGNCGDINATGTITVTDNNSVGLALTTPTLCVDTALTPITYTTTGANLTVGSPTGLPTGTKATWNSNVLTISGAPTIAGVFNYSVPLNGGCGTTINATGTITVSENSTITLTSNTGTDNQSPSINTTITPITYLITKATGANVAGLPAGVTASFASNIVTITGTPTVSGVYNYAVNLIGTCGDVTSKTGKISSMCAPIVGDIKIIKDTSTRFDFSGPGKTLPTSACEETSFPIKYYASTDVLALNTKLFSNEDLTAPANGGSLWYQNKLNATSYKIDSTGKIIEVHSCSPPTNTCDKRFLSNVTVIAQEGTITLNYFLPNGREVNERFEPVPRGGDQTFTFSILTCVNKTSVTIDGPVLSQNIDWNDNTDCCPETPTQTYGFQAIHPVEHSGTDSVTYIDANGVEQTIDLPRSSTGDAPCVKIIAQRIVSHAGVISCN